MLTRCAVEGQTNWNSVKDFMALCKFKNLYLKKTWSQINAYVSINENIPGRDV